MAVKSTIDSNSIVFKLNDGYTSDGRVKTKNVNLTGIKTTAFSSEDKQKVLNIANLLRPVLSEPVYQIALTTREILEEGE